MPPFTSILVDIDATAPAQPVLDRVLPLARASGARLRVVDTSPTDPSLLGLSREHEALRTRRLAQLTRLAGGIAHVPTVQADLLAGRPADALMTEVERRGHDLVVRARARDGRDPVGPNSVMRELLRRCPCPVWSVAPGTARERLRVAVAMDVTRDDTETWRINAQLVDTALAFTAGRPGSLVLVHAWQPPGEPRIALRTPPSAYEAALDATRRRATAGLESVRRSFGPRLAGTRAVVSRGLIEDVLVRLVIAEDVDLVVTGSPRRNPLVRRLFGSTSERLLARLPCSLLAVTPPGARQTLHSGDTCTSTRSSSR